MISLEGSLRTCKVDTGWAPRVESDRFQNPHLMVCPVWNGRDLSGRRVSPDSFYTKRAGCNSPEDRVLVENAQRPQYMEYISLDASGIQGDMYGAGVNGQSSKYNKYDMNHADLLLSNKVLDQTHDYTGQFGVQTGFRQNIFPHTEVYPYSEAMAQEQQAMRAQQFAQEGYMSNRYKQSAGFAR